MRFLVTGGAGFIGSAVVREIINNRQDEVLVLDKLTYAGNLRNLASVSASPRYQFVLADICDATKVNEVVFDYKPEIIMHLAAESHVDRSIDSPGDFISTNVVGTYNLLAASRALFEQSTNAVRNVFRFHHISTDEVFGSLDDDELFSETSPYRPNSPYAASKAASDHLVRAWHKTFALPTLLTNCSNNYGPFHFPEKLIPLIILNAIEGKPLPIYGDGLHVRDWLYVEDHARALCQVATTAEPGSSYNIGGNNEVHNIDLVKRICCLLDERVHLKPANVKSFSDLITFVEDRPGHDVRYAIDASKIRSELGWVPQESLESGMEKTVDWYLSNLEWCAEVQKDNYQRERLGRTKA